ncbi:MAG: aminotransferase class V-fold PLP-dependent enzyme [Paracoccaceae bacterium]
MQGDGSAYFIYHSIGQYPAKAADLGRAMGEFAQSWGARNDGQWNYALGKRARFIDRWRALIGAAEGTVTTAENVTAGLYSLIGALPAGRLSGRTLLVAGDCFPSLHFLLAGLADRFGFTLKTVPHRPGAYWVEDDDVIAAWGSDVALALLTWVSSTSSHRIDLARLAAHGRTKGTLIGVDITQAVGLLPFDVSVPEVDFALSTSLKWMCGTPGAGILYVAPRLIGECAPELRGWFSQPDPFSWDLTRFAFAADIRRFDNGTPGIVAALATLPALDWHAAQDAGSMLAHNQGLSARIQAGADEIGLTLASPRDPEARGGSIMVDLGARIPAADLIAALRRADVFADARGQIARFSPGAMTTDDGVTRLLRALGKALASG